MAAKVYSGESINVLRDDGESGLDNIIIMEADDIHCATKLLILNS